MPGPVEMHWPRVCLLCGSNLRVNEHRIWCREGRYLTLLLDPAVIAADQAEAEWWAERIGISPADRGR
jgi:hypothetical protein